MSWLSLIPALVLFSLSAFALHRAHHIPASSNNPARDGSNLKRMSALMLAAGALDLLAVLI
jgi:hypothetical protein